MINSSDFVMVVLVSPTRRTFVILWAQKLGTTLPFVVALTGFK